MLGQAYMINMNANRQMEQKLMNRQNSQSMPYPGNPNSRYRYTLNRRAQILERTKARIPPRNPYKTASGYNVRPGVGLRSPGRTGKSKKPDNKVNKVNMKTKSLTAEQNVQAPLLQSQPQSQSQSQPKSQLFDNNELQSKSVRVNTSNALISVILVTDNSRKYIHNSIYTIMKQSHYNLELIIVDNGSEDGTIDYIKNLRDNRIKIFALKDRCSLASCRNLGLYVSKGSFITFQDPKYISITERLDRQVKLLTNSQEPSVSVVGEQIREENDEIICNYESLMLSRDQLKTFGYFKDHEKHMLEYVKRLINHKVQITEVKDLFYIRYDTLTNGIANNEYHLAELNEFPEEEVSQEKKVEFEDIVKFGV